MKWVIINKIRKKEKFDINERKKDNTQADQRSTRMDVRYKYNVKL